MWGGPQVRYAHPLLRMCRTQQGHRIVEDRAYSLRYLAAQRRIVGGSEVSVEEAHGP